MCNRRRTATAVLSLQLRAESLDRSAAALRSAAGERGFSLVELMVTVAVVGILAALATQSYMGAIARAHVADALSTVAPMKTIVAENFAFDPNGNACNGIRDITSPIGAVTSATCSDDGTVVTVHIVMSEETGGAVADFVSSRTTQMVWNCVGDASSPGYLNLPQICR
jgi:type IV pilus assembly protein PilA